MKRKLEAMEATCEGDHQPLKHDVSDAMVFIASLLDGTWHNERGMVRATHGIEGESETGSICESDVSTTSSSSSSFNALLLTLEDREGILRRSPADSRRTRKCVSFKKRIATETTFCASDAVIELLR